jgi:glycerol-3-phosphate dehydrogenase (NAD(P)+)
MKILTLWLWAFGFAINKLIWENNPEKIFYAYELNKDIVNSIKQTREHSYFFEWYKLSSNIEILDDYDHIISDIDLLILAIPAQFISSTINWIKNKLKAWVTILNLAKWIDITTNKPISKLLKQELEWIKYNYSVLSWWMIASELVEWKQLGADLWINNFLIWEKIKKLLENENLTICIKKDVLNIELYGNLKNIMAILVGYYEWKWLGMSSIWYYLVDFYNEMKDIIKLYGWNSELDFSYYSLGWDIVATCFGNSRNRYFWNLLWKGKSIEYVLWIMKHENKHAEGYETLKAVYDMIREKEWFENVKFLYNLIK